MTFWAFKRLPVTRDKQGGAAGNSSFQIWQFPPISHEFTRKLYPGFPPGALLRDLHSFMPPSRSLKAKTKSNITSKTFGTIFEKKMTLIRLFLAPSNLSFPYSWQSIRIKTVLRMFVHEPCIKLISVLRTKIKLDLDFVRFPDNLSVAKLCLDGLGLRMGGCAVEVC